jgi:hypothetical protein
VEEIQKVVSLLEYLENLVFPVQQELLAWENPIHVPVLRYRENAN